MDLITAVMKNNLKEVKKALAQEIDVNKTEDQDNIRPLHFAAQTKDSVEIVKLLVAAGANINSEDIDGMTPLDIAKLHDNKKVIAFLKDV